MTLFNNFFSFMSDNVCSQEYRDIAVYVRKLSDFIKIS